MATQTAVGEKHQEADSEYSKQNKLLILEYCDGNTNPLLETVTNRAYENFLTKLGLM